VRVGRTAAHFLPPEAKAPAGVALWARRFAVYGTVSKMKLKPGAEDRIMKAMEGITPPGHIATYVFKSDADPNVHFVTTVFESRSAYKKFADSPEQDKRYQQMRELLAGEPEWHDGEVVHHDTKVGATH
jgi:heme-degrading monooxygenase HmoA